jgi:hypothetical protein
LFSGGAGATIPAMLMAWRELDEMLAGFERPSGYTLEQLGPEDVDLLAARLGSWYPDIQVGTESRHLEPDFYRTHYFLRGGDPGRSFYAIVCRPEGSADIVALMTLEKNARGLQISSPMGAVEPSQRGLGIGASGTAILETVGRNIGAEVAFYFATLKVARTQKNAERHGFQLVGIMPAWDRDAIAPGVVRRVYEAIYAKVLVGGEAIELPRWEALVPSTRALFTHLFGKHPGDSA